MTEDNEIKVVTRQETFNDLAVRELAKSRARCLCCIQFKRCKKEQCQSCSTYAKYQNCVSHMNDYDLTRLSSYTAAYYGEYSYRPEAFMSHQMYKKSLGSFVTLLIVGAVLFFALVAGLVGVTGDKPSSLSRYNYVKSQDEIDYETYLTIQETILMTQRSIKDVNQDGKINCVDHAIMFYLAWSTFVNEDCEIVHNVQPGIMNHLFVRITDPVTGKYIEIEPWTAIPEDVTMDMCWQNGKYDYRYNLYGETNKWLNQCKQRAYAFERFK